jgi:hypothetical protein
LSDDEGPIYRKGWDGEYRPVEGLLGPAKGHVKHSALTGEPVKARDFLGNEKRAADGSPLYEAAPDNSGAIGGIIGVLILAVFAVVAWIAAVIVGWWWQRFYGSIKRDRIARRLSWTTVGWLSPAALLLVGILVQVAPSTAPDSPVAAVGAGGGSGPQQPVFLPPPAPIEPVAYPTPTPPPLLPTDKWVRAAIPAVWRDWPNRPVPGRLVSVGVLHPHVNLGGPTVDVCAVMKLSTGSKVLLFVWDFDLRSNVWSSARAVGYGYDEGYWPSMAECDSANQYLATAMPLPTP